MEENFQLQPQMAAQRSQTKRRTVILTALLAFVLGAGAAGWLAWHGDLDRVLPSGSRPATAALMAGTGDPLQASAHNEQVTSLETRLALLEDRFSRLNLQANAAAASAGRAEGLLIALSTRRSIDRSQPLGYLEEQLRLRFANAQPDAVQTLVAFAKNPVSLDQLNARLDLLAPALAGLPDDTSGWARVKNELSSLFVVRRDPTPAIRSEARVDRAKLLLAGGDIDAAITQVERLPGAVAAADWFADARRYGKAQQALDLIETTAIIDTHRIQDAQGTASEPQTVPPGGI